MNTTGRWSARFVGLCAAAAVWRVADQLIGACTNLSLAALILFGSALYRANLCARGTGSARSDGQRRRIQKTRRKPMPASNRVRCTSDGWRCCPMRSRARRRWSIRCCGRGRWRSSLIVGVFVHADPARVSYRAGGGGGDHHQALAADRASHAVARSLHALTLVAVGYSYLMFDRLPGIFWRSCDRGTWGSTSFCRRSLVCRRWRSCRRRWRWAA